MKPSNYYHIESRDERREPPQRGSWWVDAQPLRDLPGPSHLRRLG